MWFLGNEARSTLLVKPKLGTLEVVVSALCLIFMILVSLENVKKYSHVVALFASKAKINVV